MGLKFEVGPQLKLGTKTFGDRIKVIIQDQEDRTIQTIASVTDRGLLLHPLAFSHKDTPQKIGFEKGAFDDARTIKVIEENRSSVRRTRVDKPIETTFHCRTGDSDYVTVSEAYKGITISAGDSTCVLLDVGAATSLRDTIDAFIRKAKED